VRWFRLCFVSIYQVRTGYAKLDHDWPGLIWIGQFRSDYARLGQVREARTI
jgi:hypothetical protein